MAADIVGLIYKNPLLEARLSRYPAIIASPEQPPFQDLANDTHFTEMRLRQASLLEIINYPKVQAIIQSPETVKTVTNALLPESDGFAGVIGPGKIAERSMTRFTGTGTLM